MRAGIPLGIVEGVCAVLAAGGFLFFTLRVGLRGAWSSRWVRWLTAALFGSTVSVYVLWAFAAWLGPNRWVHRAGVCASILLVVMALVVGTLPLAAIVWRIAKPKERAPKPATDPVKPLPTGVARVTRRQVAQGLAASVPVIATGSAVSGFLEGQRSAQVRLLPLSFPKLHRDLDGLRILQLSDLHLGFTRSARDLEAFIAGLDVKPDLVVLTGDVADDLRELDRALGVLRDLAPKHGVFSCLGNHEYHHDVAFVRRAHKKARIDLLIDEGGIVNVGAGRLYIGGANDPIHLGPAARPSLARSARLAMASASSDAFRLFLSHRPEGFESAKSQDIDLTLSGHTHGGHIGLLGHSAFEPIWPERYLWGLLQRDHRRLYTTSGFGHWFPFRLGCPTEAPFITLRTA